MTTILRIAVPSPLRQSFDYLPPKNYDVTTLQPGIRVKVPWRNKTRVGVLLEIAHKTQVPFHKLKTVTAVLDTTVSLSPLLLQLANWAANYYQHAIGEVITACLPSAMRGLDLPELNTAVALNDTTAPPALNIWQQQAVNTILESTGFQTFLLEGVTGSGKTEVYLQIIERKLAQQQQALILVPEIGLTPQTVARFKQRFAVPIGVLHSGLSQKEKLKTWCQAKQGTVSIIIGTRSAIFTPLAKPGVIILDEEHDLSFKQQSGFRYSARDLAVMRGQLEAMPVILGSATPSLESLQNVQRKRFIHLALPQRTGTAQLPQFQIVDMRNQTLVVGLTPTVLAAMQQCLTRQEQVLLFLNRRGFAPLLLCHACGWIAECKRCDARLTLHEKPQRLICHHCDAQQKVPQHCQQCAGDNLLPLGFGTERLEQALTAHFPQQTITRIDRDSTRRKGAMQQLLQAIHGGHSQILLGTQMLTKGHHFPNVTLVVVVAADYYLFSNDFRASERLGQLLIQVAGRAGRAEKSGVVYIQTHYPEHPLLQRLIQQGYTDFAQILLQERKAAQLPPYTYLALLRAEALNVKAPQQFLTLAAKKVVELAGDTIQLLGPVAAPMPRKAGRYRAQLFMQTKSRPQLQKLLTALLPYLEGLKIKRQVRWSVDVDPLDIF